MARIYGAARCSWYWQAIIMGLLADGRRDNHSSSIDVLLARVGTARVPRELLDEVFHEQWLEPMRIPRNCSPGSKCLAIPTHSGGMKGSVIERSMGGNNSDAVTDAGQCS
ncbi:MAG: hypothetical protein Q8M36_12070 [Reyranella sp.]|nr:hypothetical protein [Reyranella sp.]